MIQYEKRIVGFVDIIGFKETIRNTICDDPKISLDQIVDILDLRNPVGEGILVLGDFGDISESGHKMTAFSDCIVISVEPTGKGLLHLLHHMTLIGFKLIKLNMLCRGSITVGLHHQDNRYVFGPAMIEAYEIEKGESKPRIVLHKDVIQISNELAGHTHRFYNELTRVDEDDGVVYVNILRVLRKIMDLDSDTPREITEMCNEISDHIKNQIKINTNKESEKKKLIKWIWFQSYFDRATDRTWKDILNKPFPQKE